MSARLNRNEIPFYSWKGKSFFQIVSSIKKNASISSTINANKYNIFHPLPLKIYRREIASSFDASRCNYRKSLTINELNMPNGFIVRSTSTNQNGIIGTLDINYTSKSDDHPTLCSTQNCQNGFSQANNALRRVRSSGMIKRKFDTAKNNDTYYTSSSQYLVGRNRTFQQCQYNFIRQGDGTQKPGNSLSVSNIYSPNGINHCRKYTITADVTFQYQWIDSNYNTVVVPAGSYSVDDLNGLFIQKMTNNKHFFVNNYSQSKAFLLSFGYNNLLNSIELQVLDAYNFQAPIYSLPTDVNLATPPNWTFASTHFIPGFRILNNAFQQAIGYTSGSYPANQTILTNQTFHSKFSPGIQPVYVKLYYKPNNSQYAQQGGVTSSSRIARLRYNTITNSATTYTNAFGKSVANALAYGVPENGYTIKDKIGYPNTATPVISKYTGLIKKCTSKRVHHF
jgi:hypothetical protein